MRKDILRKDIKMIYPYIFVINLKGSVFMGRKIIDLTGKDFGMFHVVK
uniref:Uncharacterized protein n=1 Tax=Bacteriophage sp. TaxID=38018 RepID=A0A8D9PED2_9VIRU|nr:MAG TPA: hypothetical protein [Bacteriophage sp.]